MIKLIFVSIVLVCLSACGGNEKKPVDKNTGNSIVVINDKDLNEIIKNRNGKTLFLNVWATWCAPCVEEFPAIVQLDKNYPDDKVEVIALSVDLPSDTNGKIVPFLKQQQAKFKVIVAEEKSSDEIINMLNPEWSGAVPVTFIFDKAGKQQKYLFGAHTYKQMSSAVDSVVSM